jgi:hypothetical protein
MDLSNNLKIEILNKPSDFVLPDSLFFDTVYHLNKKGREIRTKKLIEIIKKSTNAQQWLKKIAQSNTQLHVIGVHDSLSNVTNIKSSLPHNQ